MYSVKKSQNSGEMASILTQTTPFILLFLALSLCGSDCDNKQVFLYFLGCGLDYHSNDAECLLYKTGPEHFSSRISRVNSIY